MTPRLVLHVGAMKTGTTYLQHVVRANADHLSQQGWYVPDQHDVVLATRELLGLPGMSAARQDEAPVGVTAVAPRWDALMDQVRAATAGPGSAGAIVSMEFLSFARPAGVARFLASATGMEVHVVLTVRDALRALPSQWGTLTAAGGYRHSWPAFALGSRELMAGRPSAEGRPFTRTQDVPRMIEAWSSAVPPERFSTLTVPTAASGLPRAELWRRFGEVLGVPTAGTVVDVDFDNPQLGYGSCELLRRVNVELDAKPGHGYRTVVRRLTQEHLLDLRSHQGRPRLDAVTAAAAVGLNARTLALAGQHTQLVGDPGDLPDSLPGDLDLDPGDVPAAAAEEEVWDAARAVLRGAAELCSEYGAPAPSVVDEPLGADLDLAVERAAGVIRAAVRAGAADRRERRNDGSGTP